MRHSFSGSRARRGRAALLAGSSITLPLLIHIPALAQTQLPPLQVEGNGASQYATDSSGLTKLPEPLLDTPISVTTVTQQLM